MRWYTQARIIYHKFYTKKKRKMIETYNTYVYIYKCVCAYKQQNRYSMFLKIFGDERCEINFYDQKR